MSIEYILEDGSLVRVALATCPTRDRVFVFDIKCKFDTSEKHRLSCMAYSTQPLMCRRSLPAYLASCNRLRTSVLNTFGTTICKDVEPFQFSHIRHKMSLARVNICRSRIKAVISMLEFLRLERSWPFFRPYRN